MDEASTVRTRVRRTLHFGGSMHERPEQFGVLGGAFEFVADPIAIMRLPWPPGIPVFEYVNRAFVDLFGYAPDRLIGKTMDVLDGPQTDKDKLNALSPKAAAGEIVRARVHFYTATGERRYVQIEDRALTATHRIASIRDYTREYEAETALEDANLRLGALLLTNSDAVFTLDRSGACVDANPAAEFLCGRPRAELLGDGFRSATTNGAFASGEAFPRRLESGETLAFATSYRRPDGHAASVSCKAIPMVVRDVTEGAYVIATDVTERLRLVELAERQARRTQDLWNVAAATGGNDDDRIDGALANVLIAFGMQTSYVAEFLDGETLRVTNRIGERVFDVGAVVPLAATRIGEMIARDDVFLLDDIESRRDSSEGMYFGSAWHGYICAPLFVGGKLYGAMGLVRRRPASYDAADRDFVRLAAALISAAIERRIQKTRLDRMAYVDELTQLANRAHFTRRLEAALQESGNRFALHVIDLDGFKALNDAAGHAVGDLALREVGRRLAGACGTNEDAARLGGDEFVVLQSGDPSRASAAALGARIVERIGAPYAFDGRTYELGASVGVALHPDDGTRADALMRRADAMLYRAKRSGKRRVVLSPPSA